MATGSHGRRPRQRVPVGAPDAYGTVDDDGQISLYHVPEGAEPIDVEDAPAPSGRRVPVAVRLRLPDGREFLVPIRPVEQLGQPPAGEPS